ncbi:hypothetical protein [Epilithonimonas caeni]|uniref:hypothetical protein n=1 Tax=Epilithonimonas caeni TaxID=365343 RepID=UPI000484AEDA|nr:hypothetical protein [Epilithonimonas caeni]
MELNKKNIILFILFISCFVIYFSYNKYKISKNSYNNKIYGLVDELRNIGRGNGYVQVKFKGCKKFDELCILYLGENQNDLRVGDSIYKAKNSYDYQVYRKDSFGNFQLYKTLRNKPKKK